MLNYDFVTAVPLVNVFTVELPFVFKLKTANSTHEKRNHRNRSTKERNLCESQRRYSQNHKKSLSLPFPTHNRTMITHRLLWV